MRIAWLSVLAACGGGGGGGSPTIDVTTQFQVTTFSGNGPSPLDPLQGQTIDIAIHWDQTAYNTADDTEGCKSMTIGYGADVTVRKANGPTAALVQSQILDRLDNWDIHLQLCPAAGQSSVTLESTIDELNLTFGCFGVPASAMRTSAAGYPELTSFTATQCSSTILDVVNNRVLGNDDFTMIIHTSADQLP